MPMFSMVGAGSLQERRWADVLSQVGAEVQVVQHRTKLGCNQRTAPELSNRHGASIFRLQWLLQVGRGEQQGDA